MERTGSTDKDKWGWIVCFGTIISFIAAIGHVNSFGLIYNDFIVDTHSTAKSLTTAHGVFGIMLAVGGIILNIMSKRCSLRTGGLIGAVIMIIGSFSTIFITNTSQLPITFGVLQGVGFGMMVPVCYATINHYFVKKRTTVMSICKAVQGLILILYPHLLKKILYSYGFRGTLLIISGISLHTIPGMSVMITEKKTKRNIRTANEAEKGVKEIENIILLNNKQDEQVVNANVDSSVKKDDKKRKGVNKISLELLEILNIKVLKDVVFCNICLGQSFVNFSDLTFFILQPMLLFQYGYDTAQVAACISTCAGADVAGRCALAFISSVIPINTRILFYVSTLFTLIFRLVVLQVRQFVWVITLTGCLGVLRAWLHVASPLVISNHVSHQDFPGAYALFMLAAGIVNVSCSPVVGLLKDIYEDYIPAFYALTLCCLPCLMCWPVEYIIRRDYDTRK
ncbi:monocarboxylate transporter 1-like [Pectinophora gossypiella]|uniref:monocarboxylate transporter 1-like n=1 Tax=Pectinophora gossypiella TaxID=13191 RepID=UPI00214E7233|nr:monocarboxylate transporter 1-like [Pectinophora gossypiella]